MQKKWSWNFPNAKPIFLFYLFCKNLILWGNMAHSGHFMIIRVKLIKTVLKNLSFLNKDIDGLFAEV